MNNKTKTTLRFFLAALLVVSLTVTGCNNSSEEKTVIKDSVVTVAPPAPVLKDTLKDSMEVTPGNVSPTPGGN